MSNVEVDPERSKRVSPSLLSSALRHSIFDILRFCGSAVPVDGSRKHTNETGCVNDLTQRPTPKAERPKLSLHGRHPRL